MDSRASQPRSQPGTQPASQPDSGDTPPPAAVRGSSGAGEPSFVFAYVAWLIALSATLVSLFFSEVMDLPPCSLCWYQRICLYPLVLVIGVGIVLRDGKLTRYALPLVVAGLGFAVYHNLLYYGVIPESLAPCKVGVPCSSRQINWLGFIGIPLMALGGFAGLLVTLLLHRRRQRASSSEVT
jgi:disulfide bond formation protein DsbB